ncbi:hypothetical protein [Streptomyces albipurpureus]|uniref:PBS lyase n=1 Tax=Streptomyces albipurpureus TaxID=2897419 RepID=A0ABT0UXE2_9ACTN|nr:hypothetical protein [Streptomyces sp. CWNU-1]MCM2392780.1 hypothetical protein [Streptomyces sp. CWNU-1]
MDLERVFADLDGVPWAALGHAYGEAEDLPDLLRALAGDEEQATDAFDQLWASILHQGTVYGATAAAVPYLARLAAADVRPAEMLALLGGIADSEDEFGLPAPGACRAAVVTQLPLILGLLDSVADDVRRLAVWTAGRSGCASALPALRNRWMGQLEKQPTVRAELLAALAHLDPQGSEEDIRSGLAASEPAELRVSAVMATADAGLPFLPIHRDTLVSLLPAAAHVAGRSDQERTEPLRHVVDVLLRRDTDADRAAAYRLLEAALLLVEPDAREEALWAAEHACVISRGAPARLAPALVPLLADPSFTRVASLLPILDKLGAHAAPAAPELAALVAAEGDLADRALAVLARIAPEQAAPLLARDLDHRSRTLAALTDTRGQQRRLRLPYAPELLNAIRIRLTTLVGAEEVKDHEPAELTQLLLDWGPRSAAALPELANALKRFPLVIPAALAAICPPENREATADLLRQAAGSDEVEGRCAAAEALWRLTGATGPLVDALSAALRQGAPAEHLPIAAGQLGEAGAELVPDLRSALTPQGRRRTVQEMNADIQIAVALWRVTQEAAEAVKVLGGVLAEAADGMWTDKPRTNAARAAAEIGPHAKALTPALEALLADPVLAPGAVLALRAVGSAVEQGRASDLLLTSAELDAAPAAALDALKALGTQARTPAVIRRLTVLAEGDLRVVASGLDSEIVRSDERLRAAARELLAS